MQTRFQEEVETRPIVSTIAFATKKPASDSSTCIAMFSSHKDTIVCKNCGHEKAYTMEKQVRCRLVDVDFQTEIAQLRSADEGSTIFTECVRCGYQDRLNN